MPYKQKMNEAYDIAAASMEDFHSDHTKGTIPYMINYMNKLGKVLEIFHSKLSDLVSSYSNLHPAKTGEIKEYAETLKNKLISNYKPK